MEYLGSYSNGQTPFQITMKFFDSYGMEYQTTACNESNSITGEGRKKFYMQIFGSTI